MRILVTLAALPVMALLLMALARVEAGLDRPFPTPRRSGSRAVRLRIPFAGRTRVAVPDDRVGA